MKLECVRDKLGFFGLNITKGKIYEGTAVASGSAIGFVIYNDVNKWRFYDADYFIPASALSESASPVG